ncbi:MAG: Ig-like domain-containing protein [SAR324 cluster bacterium]|nr:Ig-like domain-containing protein [SAR324 cluster bacterium]MBL7034663.1 Ig-like domain-containing protein [SAR324 cluster bacterium]
MMKIFSFFTIAFTVLLSLLMISCGQTTLKDDGLDSKSIEEASGTSSGGSSDDSSSGNSSFTVTSVSPADGATGVSRNGASITITFGDDVRLKNTDGSWTSSWTTSSTSEGSCSSSYGSKLVHISRDNFTNCHPNNGSVSDKIITLTLNGTLSSSGNYKVKVLKTSLDGSASTQSSSGVNLSTEYSFSFTADN